MKKKSKNIVLVAIKKFDEEKSIFLPKIYSSAILNVIVFQLFISFSCIAFSQSFAVFNPDTSTFPIMRANFFAFDSRGDQLFNFTPGDFELSEDGIKRKVISVYCPPKLPPIELSVVLVIDVSGSMAGPKLALAKEAALAWARNLPIGKSECAITSFDDKNYFIQDFTTDRKKLETGINKLTTYGGTNYDAAFTEAVAGGLLVAKTGKHKKIVVIFTDGLPNQDPDTKAIIKQANDDNITVFAVTLGFGCPQCLRDITTKTTGLWFEYIMTDNQVRELCLRILHYLQATAACTIEWESERTCPKGITIAEAFQKSTGIVSQFDYFPPSWSFLNLLFEPPVVKFYKSLGDTCKLVKITAVNGDFDVKSITLSNPKFRLEPSTGFKLKAGESVEVKICYNPTDSGYSYCRIIFDNDLCPVTLNAAGGYPGKSPSVRTLKLVHPNGAEVFVAGSDTIITWEGVLPEEKVLIEYSTDGGISWVNIEKQAKGLSYKWKVPNTPSNNCLARVTARANFIEADYPQVKICSQVWMSTNLDVEYYRNGDPIPEIRDSATWANATYGAWCYYKNDPANGIKYGKLYNGYAVRDPRGLAPEGWHIPSDKEWDILIQCIGGENQGGKLKSMGIEELGDGLWKYPNSYATNETGFSAHPGGYRAFNAGFWNMGYWALWWTSEVYSQTESMVRFLRNDSPTVSGNVFLLKYGCNIRCIKD